MAGPEVPRGEGERREAMMRRRRALVIGALFFAGLGTGFYVGFGEGRSAFHGAESIWTPTLAVALILCFAVAMIGGTFFLKGVMDELERERTYKAAAFGSALFMIGYPLWFLLWKGGFVAEPVHWLIYAVFVVGMLLATLWYRFR
jgi:hypothetical protein